ncbi:hypothetical protein, partial [Gemmiger sp.]
KVFLFTTINLKQKTGVVKPFVAFTLVFLFGGMCNSPRFLRSIKLRCTPLLTVAFSIQGQLSCKSQNISRRNAVFIEAFNTDIALLPRNQGGKYHLDRVIDKPVPVEFIWGNTITDIGICVELPMQQVL